LKDYRSITFGVTPIALADASGANNIKQITFHKSLADACGLTRQDLSKGLEAIGVNGEDRKVALEVMQRYYNGYRFHQNVPVEKMLYNTTLTLSFLGDYFEDPEFRKMVQNWKETNPEVLVSKLKVSFCLLSYFPDSHSLTYHSHSNSIFSDTLLLTNHRIPIHSQVTISSNRSAFLQSTTKHT
jgi:hypothetical protein